MILVQKFKEPELEVKWQLIIVNFSSTRNSAVAHSRYHAWLSQFKDFSNWTKSASFFSAALYIKYIKALLYYLYLLFDFCCVFICVTRGKLMSRLWFLSEKNV